MKCFFLSPEVVQYFMHNATKQRLIDFKGRWDTRGLVGGETGPSVLCQGRAFFVERKTNKRRLNSGGEETKQQTKSARRVQGSRGREE